MLRVDIIVELKCANHGGMMDTHENIKKHMGTECQPGIFHVWKNIEDSELPAMVRACDQPGYRLFAERIE